MKQAFEAAWLRSPAATEAQGRLQKAAAEQLAASSRVPAPWAVSLSQREGLAGAPAGSRETELGWAVPLWRPGQRATGLQANEAERLLAEAYEQVLRLRLAGELREAAGAVQLALVELAQAESHTDTLLQLFLDVERRVKAGDLAPADALQARAQWLGAQAQAQAHTHVLQSKRADWLTLTGLEQVPVDASSANLAQALTQTHPESQVAQAALESAAQNVRLVESAGLGSPELNVGLRKDIPGQGASAQHSIVVGVRMPLGGRVHRQPAIASALAQLELARTQAQRTRERLTVQLGLAALQVQTSQHQLGIEREREALLAQRALFIEKSFKAGESSLPDLLRAMAAAAEANSARARQTAALDVARARFEQSLGNLP